MQTQAKRWHGAMVKSDQRMRTTLSGNGLEAGELRRVRVGLERIFLSVAATENDDTEQKESHRARKRHVVSRAGQRSVVLGQIARLQSIGGLRGRIATVARETLSFFLRMSLS
jgi:hypothetical protein